MLGKLFFMVVGGLELLFLIHCIFVLPYGGDILRPLTWMAIGAVATFILLCVFILTPMGLAFRGG